MSDKKPFQFEISLSVLNHLGRNLYRNFITILGEAISNAWDADANNVWIYIDKKNNNFFIKDDGSGMDSDDFQNKFLKVGYSKRKDGSTTSPENKRPYIGAKGIGKLALLSSAEKISIISKKKDTDYIGGLIDNSGLDKAIEHDMTPDQYPLEDVNLELFGPHVEKHNRGTIIYFDQAKENIRNTVEYLKKLIALYFRFSLIDKSFNIFLNDEPVTLKDLKDLSEATEFLWIINKLDDPYMKTLSKLGAKPINIKSGISITGFIATVSKPRDLKITGTEERVGVDLFVNGRLREKDLLKHIPTARVAESYMYGQIHFDELDKDGQDRFTSSRESVVASDDKYQSLLQELKKKIIPQVLDEWDKLRLARGEDGDDENTRKTKKERRASSLYTLSSKEYTSQGGKEVNDWVKELKPDAEFNIPAYVDCFLSENLVRKYIDKQSIQLTQPAIDEVSQYKTNEHNFKADANISFDIRENNDDLSYIGMDTLAKVVDDNRGQNNTQSLVRDSKEYKPLRNAVGHTGLLTDVAKQKLKLVYENIKARVNTLLSNSDNTED